MSRKPTATNPATAKDENSTSTSYARERRAHASAAANSPEPPLSALEEELLDPQDIEDISAYEFVEPKDADKVPRPFLTLLKRIVWRKRFLLAVSMLAVGILLFYLRSIGYLTPESVLSFLKQHPVVAPLSFLFIYSAMVVFLLPTLPLNLAAGLLWGPLWGTALSVVAATAGACVSFLLARHLASELLQRKFRHRAWRWLRREIDRREWKAVAFTRINPIFPFGPVNYFFGLTAIPFSRFAWATALFIVPPSLMFASIGDSVGGIVLTGEKSQLVRNVLLICAAVTILLLLRAAMKPLFKERRG